MRPVSYRPAPAASWPAGDAVALTPPTLSAGPRPRTLRPGDLAEVDDLLLAVRDVAHDLLGAPLEDVLLDPVELVADLAQHREAVVERVVDDLVEQVAGALREERLAQLLRSAAALEQVLDRPQRDVGQRDQVA